MLIIISIVEWFSLFSYQDVNLVWCALKCETVSDDLYVQATMPLHISWYYICTRIAFGQSGPATF
jgi:hypothetical protein